MDYKAYKAKFKSIKQLDDQQEVFTFIATTTVTDRERDLVIAEGIQYDNFLENPVFLWAHLYREWPIGKVIDLRVKKDAVEIDVVFAATAEGRKAAYLYREGFLNAVSVGFMPLQVVEVRDDVDEVEVEVAGKKRNIKLDKFDPKPRWIVTSWELLEVSAVTVPANPQALIQRAVAELADRYNIEQKLLEPVADTIEKQLSDSFVKLKKAVEAVMKGAIPPHHTEINFELNWDKRRAIANAAKYASSDGSGKKETIDWAKFALFFAWRNPDKPNAFTGYKLPHHDVVDGKMVAIWRGITAAMAAYHGARGGVDIPDEDRPLVYEHLATHYRDAGKEPPPDGRKYTEEELKAIEEDRWPLEADDKPDKQDDGEMKDIKLLVEELKSQLIEMEANLQTRLYILEEVVKDLKSVEQKSELSVDEPETPEANDNELVNELFDRVAKWVKRLELDVELNKK